MAKLMAGMKVLFWAAATAALAGCVGAPGDMEKILIDKSAKKMYLLDAAGRRIKKYEVRLGLEHGQKTCRGDMKTPTGEYRVNGKWDSKYIRFISLDYPNASDVARAAAAGCDPGGAIGIHAFVDGLDMNPNGSEGCITVWSKDEILEIDSKTAIGTPVEIRD